VLAVVNGARVTTKEIDARIADQLKQVQQLVIDARKRQLDIEINNLLLAAEAQRRGVSPAQLLEGLVKQTPEPTEADARAFYRLNREKIQGEWSDTLKDQIIQFLRDERQGEEGQKFVTSLRAAAQIKMLTPAPTPPASIAERARVFATVNGAPVTSAMIEDALKPTIYNAQMQIYSLRREQLDRRINDLLIEQEASKRRTTSRDLFVAEVESKVRPVTDDDAREFYDANRAQINGDFAKKKEEIKKFMTEQRTNVLASVFADQLRGSAAVQTFLNEPLPPSYQIATDDQPTRGNVNAPVTLVEFSDFQCPSCSAMQPYIDQLMDEFGDRVRLVVRDFPLKMHANAEKAAEAAEAARAQGKYWEYARLLYANQSALDVAKLKAYASQLGLDRRRFDAMLDSGQLAKKVLDDASEGARLGVNSTPSFFVNGRPVEERTYVGLKAAIEAALAEKGVR
jgi:protein-disulfide isomerase